MQETLREIGLTNTEVKVYLALLDLGSGLAGEITKKSEVNRTNVYDALERLIEKGLATYVISANRKVFEAISPERLKEILEEKTNKLNKILPQLKQIHKESKIKEEATIFKGKKGIKSVFEDILKDKQPVFSYGAEGRFGTTLPAYHKEWNLRRAKAGIKIKMIYSETVKRKKLREYLKLKQMRFLPKEYEFPSNVLIYGNKVVTIVWADLPFAFLIKSKHAAKSYMNFFKIFWKIANP